MNGKLRQLLISSAYAMLETSAATYLGLLALDKPIDWRLVLIPAFAVGLKAFRKGGGMALLARKGQFG